MCCQKKVCTRCVLFNYNIHHNAKELIGFMSSVQAGKNPKARTHILHTHTYAHIYVEEHNLAICSDNSVSSLREIRHVTGSCHIRDVISNANTN